MRSPAGTTRTTAAAPLTDANTNARLTSARKLTRRRFPLLASALGLSLTVGRPATARPARAFLYRGVRVAVGTSSLTIGRKSVKLFASNGAYRAAGFMYSPQPTSSELARRVVDKAHRATGRS